MREREESVYANERKNDFSFIVEETPISMRELERVRKRE